MGIYGDTGIFSVLRRLGVGNQQVIHTAAFTTAGASAPTVDSNKTRGPISIARTGTGVHTITLPKSLRNVVVLYSLAGGTTAQIGSATMAEGATTCTVTTVTAGGSTAADSTGVVVNVVIIGTQR